MKQWYKSITIWSAIADAVLKVLESNGIVPSGTPDGLVTVIGIGMDFLTMYGRTRATGPIGS